MGIEFDEEKWKEIERQWADDDAHAEPDAEPDADADDAMVLPEMDFTEPEAPAPALRLRDTSPATAGAGQKGARPSVAEPAASRPPIASLDWKGLGDRLSLAELGKSQSKGYESMLANAGNSGQYVQNQNAGNVGPAVVRGEMEVNRERQGSDARDLSMQGQKAAMGVKSAMSDPNSLQSQKAREAVRAMGVKTPSGFDNYSADDIQRFVKTGELARLEESRARSANAAADDVRRRAAGEHKAAAETQQLENSRKSWAKELKAMGVDPSIASQKDIDRVMQRMAAREGRAFTEAQGEKPKPLTAGQLAETADFETAGSAVDDLFSEFERSGQTSLGSRLTGKVSDATGVDMGDTSRYLDKSKATAQVVGLILEEGKLGEADLPRYQAMMPQPGDSIERAAAKRDNIKKLLAKKASGRTKAYAAGGYKVPPASDETPKPAGKIRVKNKQTGATGTISPQFFDEAKYERIDG